MPTDTASHFVQMYSHMLKIDQFSIDAALHLSFAYKKLLESHRQRNFNPPPFVLLKDIQEWVSRMPESESALLKKIRAAEEVVYRLVLQRRIFAAHTPPSNFIEKQNLDLFALFFSDFFGREDISNLVLQGRIQLRIHVTQAICILDGYIARNTLPDVS